MNLSIATKFGLPAIALAAVLVACPDPTPPVDTTAPQFSSSTPANDTAAIATTAGIKIVFNEPMNKTATQGAVTFSPAVTGATYVWGNGDKELTINPPAAGWSTAASYTVTIGAGAKDVAGNSFVAVPPKTFKFKAAVPTVGTVKNATLKSDGNIAYDFATTAPVVAAKYAFNATSVSKPGTTPVGNAFGGISRGVLRFDLPVGVTAASIKSAKLILNQDSVTGTPFTDLGGIQVKGVSFIADPGTNAKNEYLAGDGAGVDGVVNAGKISADVSAYMTGLTTTTADFVVRFKTEPVDAGAGYKASTFVRFSSAEATDATLKPVLEITLK